MKKTSKKILFFGNDRLATGVTTQVPTLRALIDAGYEVPAVVIAQEDQVASRTQRKLEVAEVAHEHGIPLLALSKLSEAEDKLRAFGAETAVLVSYGKIVPQNVIDIFPKGIWNIHPSLLPRYRGPTPIESAILNGDKETGVSLMKLTAELDKGPVYAQSTMFTGDAPNISKQMLAHGLGYDGARLLTEHLSSILDGTAPAPAPQNDALATYSKRITKKDGIINWNKSAEQLEREIRAYAGWPRSRTKLSGKEVVITKVKLLDAIGAPGSLRIDSKRLVVFCKWGALEIQGLIPAGKKEMSAQAFLAGYKGLFKPD